MRKLLHACSVVLLLQSAAWAQTAQQNSFVIKGQVLDDQGRPVSGAQVTANPDGGLKGKAPSASSDSRGEFTIVVYKADNYKMTASKPADGYPSSFNPFYYPAEDSLAHVMVREGQAAPFATIHLGPKAGKIAGRIVDAETGRVVEDVQFTLCRAEIPKYCHRPFTKYPGGNFDILVPETPFTLQISASGYKDWYGSEGVDHRSTPLRVDPGITKVMNVLLEKLPALGDDANSSLLAPPRPLSPENGAVFNHYPRTTRLEWSAVPGAVSYAVELEVCQPGGSDGTECRDPQLLQIRGNPPLSGIEGTSYEFLFIGAQPGRWRVWAVDANGRMGARSTWSQFIYKW